MPTSPAKASAGYLELDTPVRFVAGIGPRRAEWLEEDGVLTVGDLVDRAPFRYEDRCEFRPVRSVRDGEWVLLRGEICSTGGSRTGRRGFSIFEALIRDGTGAVPLKFFNQPYLKNVYKPGTRLIVYGQVRRDSYSRNALSLINPECEIIEDESSGASVHSGRIVPIYRKLGGLRPRALRQIMYAAISRLSGDTRDPIPSGLRRKLNLLPRDRALAEIHFPEPSVRSAEDRAIALERLNSGLSPAHKRMIFEELFTMQVGIQMVRERRVRLTKSRRLEIGEPVRQAIKKILPFHPTPAQKKVLKEIADDMRSDRPMNRLLQGDVGSGKTIVAAQAAIVSVENGFQVAIMAPTEILAEQHAIYFRHLLEPLGYTIDLLKGGLRAKERREALARIRGGETQIAVGTHALIQEDVEFRNLALVVVDEQHRFGVVQRSSLRAKGDQPDLLVMTATPIPRSLALTLYGDLDVSTIDELPPGRKPIETRWCREKDRPWAYEMMQEAVSGGNQVYVVYPLVEESEKTDLMAATEMEEYLRTRVFPDYAIGLLHGRMKSSEKDRAMNEFASGGIQILVCTTVVEVGVDVPNATLMVIEHAERFGLAQLHQLRGRVGRGTAQSHCILVGNVRSSPDAKRRLEIMCETNDGFRIAQVDLELRGPGEVIGTRQSGVPMFRYANLVRDLKALELARIEGERFVRTLRIRPDDESRRVAEIIRRRWHDRYGLVSAG